MKNKECQLTSLQASTPLGNQCSTLQSAIVLTSHTYETLISESSWNIALPYTHNMK